MHGNPSDSFLAWTKVCDMGDREMLADNYITRLSQLTMVFQLKRKATNRKMVDGKFSSVTLPSAFRFNKAKGANNLTYQCLTNGRPVFLIFLLFLFHFLSFPPSSLVLFMFSNTGNLFFSFGIKSISRAPSFVDRLNTCTLHDLYEWSELWSFLCPLDHWYHYVRSCLPCIWKLSLTLSIDLESRASICGMKRSWCMFILIKNGTVLSFEAIVRLVSRWNDKTVFSIISLGAWSNNSAA